MSTLTDRTAYLRGLAEGMGIDKEKNENRLILELLNVVDEMAQKINELEGDLDDLDEYVESIDGDLGDMEEVLFGEDDDERADCEDEDCDCEECSGCDMDADEPLDFDCPHCGKTLQIKASDIDFDNSPLCPSCHQPFFPDTIDGEDDNK